MNVITYLKRVPTERRNLRGGVAIDKPGGYERDWRMSAPNQWPEWWLLQTWRENVAAW